jgi:hypothetical protein
MIAQRLTERILAATPVWRMAINFGFRFSLSGMVLYPTMEEAETFRRPMTDQGPVVHGMRRWTDEELINLDPDGPLDHLLVGFESAYRMKRPENRIFVGTRETTVAELMREEREEKIGKFRQRIRELQAARAAAKESADFQAIAVQGKHRIALSDALEVYQGWASQLREANLAFAQAQQQKSDLRSSEAPIATLKKSLVDAEASTEANRIRLEQIQAREPEFLRPLEDALTRAQQEFSFRKGKEYTKLLAANRAILQSMPWDRRALERQQIYNVDGLASCFLNVTRLDTIGRDSFASHPADRARELLKAFKELEAEIGQT